MKPPEALSLVPQGFCSEADHLERRLVDACYDGAHLIPGAHHDVEVLFLCIGEKSPIFHGGVEGAAQRYEVFAWNIGRGEEWTADVFARHDELVRKSSTDCTAASFRATQTTES
jgi:hypothetical protein